jgi:hypothetical protein
METLEREPKPGRTKKGTGAGAKLDLSIYYYKAPDGLGADYGTFYGRDDSGRWELHFADLDEMHQQLSRVTTTLQDEATAAREETADERVAGEAVWLKAIGAQGWPADEQWWKENNRGQHIDFPYRPKSIRPGDLMIVYAAGTGKVVGIVRAAGEFYEGGNNERWPYRIDTELVKAVPISQGVDLNGLSSERELGKSIRQKSHVRLSPAEAAAALAAFGDDDKTN